MVFAYSPHRESGATLHIPSPTNSPHSDQNPALAQLRRSLSRSPSRGPAFRLVTSKSSSPTLNSPLSPSPLTPSRRSNTWGTDTTATSHDLKPLASPFLPNSKRKHRAGVRHLSPMRPTGRSLGIQRSPVRRILADSSDHGNAISFQSTSSGEGAENEGQTCEIGSEKMEISEPTAPHSAQERDNYLAPRHAINRRERPNGYFDIVKSSPLKRSEGSTNLDLASFGTPAKRRSLHGAPFGPDFNIFDYGLTSEKPNLATQAGEGATGINADQDSPNSFTPMPYRSSSLRRTTLQQRLDKPSMGKIRPSMDNLFDSRTPNSSETKARNRLSLDFPVPQVSRESPFSNENLPSASIHPAPLRRQETSESRTLQVSSRHPLARTISQSSSSSGLAQDSPTHVPIRHPDAHRTRGDHSWSLPFGSTRPMLHDVRTTNSSSEQSSFATPDNYKLAKPLPAAFMSTGLISKRNRNIDNESLEVGESVGNMPDTPCKRPTSLTSIPPQPTPDINLHKAKQARHTMHSFGTPSTPFNLQVSTAVGNGNTKSFPVFGSSFNSQASRRGSFTTPDDAEDALRSPLAIFQNKHNKSFDLPPTPTKQALDPGNSPSSNFRSPVSPSIHSVRREENVIRSPEIAVNCKSIFVSTPDAARGGGKSGSQSSPSSNVLRFRSLNSISSFSKRPQGYSRSHCPTPILKNSPSPSVSSKRTQNAKKTLPTASPVLERRDCTSPHTPLDAMAPPDPSGLSISAQGDKTVAAGYQIVNARSSFGMPATPTAPRDSFGRSSRFGSSLTPVHHSVPPEVDASITSKFDKVEPFNTGEFSQVFRVSSRSNQVNRQASFNSPFGKQSPGSTFSEQVWAVKKATKPYIGRRDRQRKLQEVEILKALGHADHTINYMDSWEYKDHLYIQTEFCEEGTLESFLEKAGQNARLDDFRIWKIMLELSLGLRHIHDSGFIHLDLKPANILITFEGVLKIADFGMATTWPAQAGIEGEGDRGYIGPEILKGQFDKPADVFAFGLIMLEIAGNVRLPDNGASWQRLRSGDMSDVPSLTSSSELSCISRDSSGNPIFSSQSFNDVHRSTYDSSSLAAFDFGFDQKPQSAPSAMQMQTQRAGELHTPPEFMINPEHHSALDKIVRWMISPAAFDRPSVHGILATEGVRWTEARRRAGATIFEGNYGPADDVLQDDAEMIDV